MYRCHWRSTVDMGYGIMDLTHSNTASWLETIWCALECHRENSIPEGVKDYDEEWDDICTAMAWISEELGQSEPTAREAAEDRYKYHEEEDTLDLY